MAERRPLRVPAERADAASRRRLSRRDMRELASLTANLSLAGARAFERYVVVVHLSAVPAEPAEERPAGAPAPTGAADGGEHGKPARQVPPRTARQQRRFERGQRRKEQRRNGNNTNSLESTQSCSQEVAAGEPTDAASGRRVASSACAISEAVTTEGRSSADAASAGSAEQQQQLQHQHTACTSMLPRAVQLNQQQKRDVSVDGKRGPSTPSGESGSSPSRPVSKRAHVAKALVHDFGSDPCSDSVTGRKPELLGSALNSKAELSSSACCSQDLESDSDRAMDSGDEYQRILDAMKAASEGNEEAHSFLFQLYHSDQMPPELKRLMEELIDNG
jgi:hypothetical protein